ncbi:amidophosphoribosyltransferase [Candidatus Roizmanbacteria bacterium CG23_combo_of_CG06-09_8_20_14_all_35_49]|uniref:Amidophosphoribosyltransferase n=1 Tax=Candidatus Roizmanbacteria bacterium CG23_combo_of_CG06-09_8_20_14_all_35_49 TaxID=1974863 RepID=A0A2G9Y7H2_9BACT|nr:MAG: amidophosphoribosyltransferase [Candidatus Roizmanbacteria bacterium CG23_combo_of_CG06-09_8_20_14_all_35_49]
MGEKCGIFGIFAPKEEVARLTFYGLLALQHRGQESAGIASADYKTVRCYKEMGLVSQVFTEAKIRKLKGKLAIGHTRYSTAGDSSLKNAQPIILNSKFGDLALAHNGNLANYQELKKYLFKLGHGLNTTTDSEVIMRVILAAEGKTLREKMIQGISRIKGAFSLVILSKNKLYVIRDQWGVRPLVIGKINTQGWIAASESTAIESIGGRVVREVRPGELIEISQKGLVSFQEFKNQHQGFCIFEYLYFSRPDSVINDQLVHSTRMAAGKILVREYPVKADLVISVPDSGTSAAIGYSQASKIMFQEGLIKSRYVGRTFIQPNQRIRDLGVSLKFSPLSRILKDKRVILVDDSIVRGTTIAQLIKILKAAGVKAVHVRIASPPFKNPCYLGIDVSRYSELIASRNSVEAIRKKLKADSLGYLSLEGLKKAIGGKKIKFCTGCFNNHYPI